MRKLLLLAAIALIALNVQAQEHTESQFPYGKMLKMTDQQLKEAKFKYDGNKNQYVLIKQNGLNQTAAILGALNGSAANYIPHVNDYQVTIQRGQSDVAYITVVFYDSKIYHDIMTFASDQGSDLLETSSSKIVKHQFGYAGYGFELSQQVVGQAAIVSGGRNVSSKDQSYDIYSFTIHTGEAPYSDWLVKEAEKQAKRDAKGKKKQSAADLM